MLRVDPTSAFAGEVGLYLCCSDKGFGSRETERHFEGLDPHFHTSEKCLGLDKSGIQT